MFKEKCSSTGCSGLILTLAISVLFIGFTFDLNFILGEARYWAMERTDVTQHVAGMAMYLSSPWHFPLLAFDSLNYPQGTRVTFVDGIPLFALLLKIVLPKHMGFINPLGYWAALCFMLQGISAWWISKELEIKSWFFLIFLLGILLTYPAFMMRLKHVSLLSHWIILFAIALYIRGNRLTHTPTIAWTIFLVLSFYINIYLFAMAAGIYVASTLEIKQKISTQRVAWFFLPFIALIPTLFIFLLPLPPVSFTPEMGFDLYGMSVFSPITGGKLIQWQVNILPGQRDEGFNYLGLGIILTFLYVLLAQHDKCYATIKKHKPFFILICLYFIYALSSHVYFGSQLIAIIDYPRWLDFITSEFRCSGRFFWPVGYAIIIFSAYILYRQLSARAFSIFVSIMLAIQMIDISDCYLALRSHSRLNPPHVLDYTLLDKALGNHVKYIYFYPKYKCTSDYYRNDVLLPVMRYAAVRHLAMNTGYIARYKPACNDVAIEIAHSKQESSVYIFTKDEYSMSAILNLMGNTRIHCQALNIAYICKFTD